MFSGLDVVKNLNSGCLKASMEAAEVERLTTYVSTLQFMFDTEHLHIGELTTEGLLALIDTKAWDEVRAPKRDDDPLYKFEDWREIIRKIIKISDKYIMSEDDDDKLEKRMIMLRWFEDHKEVIWAAKVVSDGIDEWWNHDIRFSELYKGLFMDLYKILDKTEVFAEVEAACIKMYNIHAESEEPTLRL